MSDLQINQVHNMNKVHNNQYIITFKNSANEKSKPGCQRAARVASRRLETISFVALPNTILSECLDTIDDTLTTQFS